MEAQIDELATLLFGLDTGGLTTGATTTEITRAITRWATSNGWHTRTEVRVEPEQSVQLSRIGYMDVVVTRGETEPDLAIEIDSTDKPWSLAKLKYAAAAGMHAVWVRWGDEAWAGVYEDVDVIQLTTQRRSAARTRPEHDLTLW